MLSIQKCVRVIKNRYPSKLIHQNCKHYSTEVLVPSDNSSKCTVKEHILQAKCLTAKTSHLRADSFPKCYSVKPAQTKLYVHFCESKENKILLLQNLLKQISQSPYGKKVLVFTWNEKTKDKLYYILKYSNFSVHRLLREQRKEIRDIALENFRYGTAKKILLISNKIAAGLDVEGVSHVINFDCPSDPKSYVHRIGLIGCQGEFHSLLTNYDGPNARGLIDLLKEANQEVPQELIEMVNNPDELRSRHIYANNYDPTKSMK